MKKIGKIIIPSFIVIASVILFFINYKGIKPLEEVKKKTENNVTIDDVADKTCMCDFYAEKYKDWEKSGYIVQPSEEYDENKKSQEYGAYGTPIAMGMYYDEMMKNNKEIIEKKMECAKEEKKDVFEADGKTGKIGLYDKDNLTEIGKKFCNPFGMVDICVNSVEIQDTAEGYIDENGAIFGEYFEIVDKENGELKETQIIDEAYKDKYKKTGNIVMLVVNITLESNCPWVQNFDIRPELVFLKEDGEYLISDNDIPIDSMYTPRLGIDGMPVYFDKRVYSDGYEYSYLMHAGEKQTINLCYLMEDTYLDNAYIIFNGGDTSVSSTYFACYQNIIKVK